MSEPLRAAMRPFGVSVFSRITELADRHQAINLAQGFPDFDPPRALLAAAAIAMSQRLNQYAPSAGYPLLRQAVATHSMAHYAVAYDPVTEITVTAGATEAMWSATTALMEPGDEAIIIEPFYETYPPCVAAAGGRVRFVPTSFPDFRLDLDRLAAAFNRRTKLVFLNTPGNPSGQLLTMAELATVGELAARHDAYIIADETYEHLVYDGRRHLSVAQIPECRDRTVTVSSASKTFSATGWRIGWAKAPAPLTAAIRRVHQFVTFAAPSPLQHAVAVMLAEASTTGYFESLASEYAQRRDLLLDYLDKAGLEVAGPAGAFFVVARCDGDEVEYCERLASTTRVAATPVSAFYHDATAGRGLVRFVFCKQLSTLHEAGRRLTGG